MSLEAYSVEARTSVLRWAGLYAAEGRGRRRGLWLSLKYRASGRPTPIERPPEPIPEPMRDPGAPPRPIEPPQRKPAEPTEKIPVREKLG